MNVVLPKLLRQTLAQSPDRKLDRRDPARPHVSTDARRGASEEERSSRTALIKLILLKRQDRPARKAERCGYVELERSLNLLLGHLEERLPHFLHARVPEGTAHL